MGYTAPRYFLFLSRIDAALDNLLSLLVMAKYHYDSEADYNLTLLSTPSLHGEATAIPPLPPRISCDHEKFRYQSDLIQVLTLRKSKL